MNTKIEYLYRDAGNYKKYNTAIICGEITPEQVDMIIDCLDCREWFIPEQVGLPAERLEEFSFDSDEDHPFLELRKTDFSLTEDAPDCDITVEELVANFGKAKGQWYLDNFGW
ncbi:MAG: hypothetical protein LIO67_07495 [Lachnospiraceae bacterium]|nr:hypothetical protein [Lachnospiraceae bacterium]